MANSLTLNGQSTLFDSTEYPYWEPNSDPDSVKGLWEQSMYFDTMSPNISYTVIFRVFKLLLTPARMRMYISRVRDLVGEGPFTATWSDGDAEQVVCAGLIWKSGSVRLVDDDPLLRGAHAELEFVTAIKPVWSELE